MHSINLQYPELPELAGRSHEDLPGLLGRVSLPDQADVIDAEALCHTWADAKFMELLSTTQLEGRLPNIGGNIDSSHHGKVIVHFDVSDGFLVEDIRNTIQAAWDATLNTYAEAFYIRVKEILRGRGGREWNPDHAVKPPTI